MTVRKGGNCLISRYLLSWLKIVFPLIQLDSKTTKRHRGEDKDDEDLFAVMVVVDVVDDVDDVGMTLLFHGKSFADIALFPGNKITSR